MKRQKLGQHYLVDEGVIQNMIREAEILPGEKVLEIGTGRGALTEKLLGLTSDFEAFEIDRENYEQTVALIGKAAGGVHLDDVFKHKPTFDVLVSSLPYSRSSVFIEWLSKLKFRKAVVLLQEDFVRKLTARPGMRDYRAISAIAQISFEVNVLVRVGRASFSPPPKVGSLIVSIASRRRLPDSQIRMVKKLFTLRRKCVATAMAMLDMAEPVEDFGERRVYSLAPDEVLRLCTGLGAG